MSLFNMWNCRVLPTWVAAAPAGEAQETEVKDDAKKYNHLNIFDSCFANWWFLIVFLAEVNLTYLMTSYSYFGIIFNTTPLLTKELLTVMKIANENNNYPNFIDKFAIRFKDINIKTIF